MDGTELIGQPPASAVDDAGRPVAWGEVRWRGHRNIIAYPDCGCCDLADLLDRYVRAWHTADIPALVALLRTDAQMAMPPTPSWYAGRDAIAVYLRQLFSSPFGRHLRLRPTAANRQPALAVYAPAGSALVPFAVKVFTVDGDRISGITGFAIPHLFPAFQLPDRFSPSLPRSD